MATDKARIMVDAETANVVADAIAYYMVASSDNFGSGYEGMDATMADQMRHERKLVGEFVERLIKLSKRLKKE